MKKLIIPILISSLLISGFLSGCGSSNNETALYTNEAVATDNFEDAGYNYYKTEEVNEVETKEPAQAENENKVIYQEKLVYTCNIDLETLNYYNTVDSIKNKIAKFDGVIESENETDNEYNWYYNDYQKTSGTLNNYLTIRIPSKYYFDFLDSLDGEGKIVSKSSNVENISKKYYNTESIVKSLKIQEERLLEMMEQCETIEEMITVETRLTEVQTQINSYNNELSYMDTNVNFSTININIKEVVEYDETLYPEKTNTFFDRLINTIKDSCKSFLNILEWLLFFVIRMIPVLIIFIPIIILIIKIIKKFKKRKLKKSINKEEKTES